ncbi:hypothetical protein FM112_08440 [Gulosibacter sp. 10]|nr:hypothetical protein FM112_08440 [Gulosibacter sp. 10]
MVDNGIGRRSGGGRPGSRDDSRSLRNRRRSSSVGPPRMGERREPRRHRATA